MSKQAVPHPGLAFLLILLGSFLVYGNTLANGFVWDDLFLITETDAFRDPSNLGRFFTTTFWDLAHGYKHPYYRPMQPLLIFLTSRFSGIQPWGYHVVSIGLHALVTFLFFLFLSA